jgi:hypothetical protein
VVAARTLSTTVRGSGEPATMTTASAASSTASAASPPVGSRRVRIAWRLRRCVNVGSSRSRQSTTQDAGRRADGGRELDCRVAEHASRVEQVHIGYAGDGRRSERSHEARRVGIGRASSLGHRGGELETTSLVRQHASSQAAPKRAQEVGSGVGAMLAGPVTKQLVGLGERVGEERPRIVGDALAELQRPGDRHDPWQQRLEQAAPKHRILGAREQRGHEPGARELVETTSRFERRDESEQVDLAARHHLSMRRAQRGERAAGGGGAAELSPLGSKRAEDVGCLSG